MELISVRLITPERHQLGKRPAVEIAKARCRERTTLAAGRLQQRTHVRCGLLQLVPSRRAVGAAGGARSAHGNRRLCSARSVGPGPVQRLSGRSAWTMLTPSLVSRRNRG